MRHSTLRSRALTVILFVVILGAPSFHRPLSATIMGGTMGRDTYAQEWKKVDSILSRRLPKSALELVERIHARAVAERNQPQIIKAILYRAALHAEISDEGELRLIDDIRAELRQATNPVRSILQSVLAEMYWCYYATHRWQIRDRTHVADTASQDFRTWDAATFVDTVSALHLASIDPVDQLTAIPLTQMADLLTGWSTHPELRPTLFDVLAHRALAFFSNDEVQLPRATREFEITTLDGLRPADQFCAVLFQTPDPSDRLFRAVRIHQQLLRHMLDHGSLDGIVDADLLRLGFLRAITFHDDKDTTYYAALSRLLDRCGSDPSAARVLHALASYHMEKGDMARAMELCEKGMALHPGSPGAMDCASLKSHIMEKSLSLAIERNIAPDTPAIVSTGFRNISTVWYRVYVLDSRWADWLGSWQDRDTRLQTLLRSSPAQAWQQDLPVTTDFREHRVDVTIPALPRGRYILLASPREDFATAGNAIACVPMTVTRVSVVTQTRVNGDLLIMVQDAVDGSPLVGAEVTVFESYYDYKLNRQERRRLQRQVVDANGCTLYKAGADHETLTITVVHKGEEYTPEESRYAVARSEDVQEHVRSLVFTDRSLYRPGQTIHVKGIVMSGTTAKPAYRVRAGERVTVEFLDANFQKIADQVLTTNAFGSWSCTFTAPVGVLTGRMTIRDPWGSAVVRVEEYKRPKFEVEFPPITGAHRLDDVVTAVGSAKAYAGSNIDGASITWRVVREARYPYWRWWWVPRPASPAKEIAHGTTTTDERGEFRIAFSAIPDRSVDRASLPVFTYRVTADVTDVNGETHTGSTAITIGTTAIDMALELPDAVTKGAWKPAVVTTHNLAGEPLPATVAVTLERLTGPDRILRSRILPAPDLHVMTEDRFITLHPRDVYRDEDRPERWPAAASLRVDPLSTAADGRDSLRLDALAAGVYRLTLTTKDVGGTDVTLMRVFTVNDPEVATPVVRSPNAHIMIKTLCEPGESAVFGWGSSHNHARVLYQLEQRGRIIHEEWLVLDNEFRIFTVPVHEEHRGGMAAHFTMVHDQRLHSWVVPISIPWTNRQLTIETATFRDRLVPGQQEEWRLTIRGMQRDALAAEVVAAMYDASLDAIYRGDWPSFSWPLTGPSLRTDDMSFGCATAQLLVDSWNQWVPGHDWRYPGLELFILSNCRGFGYRRAMLKAGSVMDADYVAEAMPAPAMDGEMLAVRKEMSVGAVADEGAPQEVNGVGAGEAAAPPPAEGGLGQVKARTNFNETAFFFPMLATDERGDVVLRFTMPEALTRWRFTAFAHTRDMCTGTLERSAVTQKDLMVMPNAPRFLREGDAIVLPAKITNMTDHELRGTARVQFFDAVTMEPVDARFGITASDQNFTVGAGVSTSVAWRLTVPSGLPAVVYRIVAKAGDVSDGEEAPLPVLPNRMLVTETLPMSIRGNQTRSFTFDKLVASASSPTLRQHRLTLEMTSNPAWYAVQALPYLMEFPYECSEQVFNRFYANSIAAHLVNSSPKIRRVFEQWRTTDALVSNLEKNQELKSLLLQETPWVMQAKNEGERKKRIALLFDLTAMSNNLGEALQKLAKAQTDNGGWPWFPGMPESRHITQYIVTGFGHLRALGVALDDARTRDMIEQAVHFIDRRMREDYEEMKRRRGFNSREDHLGGEDIQYLYGRSFFPEIATPRECAEAVDFWTTQARKYWTSRCLMSQGMIALALHRMKDARTPADIVASLRERALQSDEMGMYWKQDGGWFWYQAPIETQALLVEVFDEVAADPAAVEELKIWLLKQKQVQDWKTTVATAEACYALLKRGSDLLASDRLVEVTLGGRTIDPRVMDGGAVEAGTGHYTVSWSGAEIDPAMGRVTVTKRDSGIAWGALFWQYYEQLDRITFAKSPLWIAKRVFRQVTTDKGVVLEPITEASPLHVGDVLKVRIEIRVDRDMEYIHLKDMRGSGLELINQLSTYRWQGGLGYYEAPKDASVNFFLHWLPKGAHVFEYPLRVSHEGTFSNGISSIQSMYAPEFAGHTSGIMITVAPR